MFSRKMKLPKIVFFVFSFFILGVSLEPVTENEFVESSTSPSAEREIIEPRNTSEVEDTNRQLTVLTQLAETKKSVRNFVNNITDQFTKFENRLEQLEKGNEEPQKRLEEMQKRLPEQKNCSKFEQSGDEEEQKVAQMQKKLDEQKEMIEALQSKIYGLEKSLQEKNKINTELQRELDQHVRSLVEQRSHLFRTEQSLRYKTELIFELERKLPNNFSKTTSPWPKNCKVLKENDNHASGAYIIQPKQFPFIVWCDMDTKGGGWTIFQNRSDGSLDFARNWTDYKKGFGDISGKEFWLGLQHLHELTEGNSNELMIILGHKNGTEAFASYDNFTVEDELGLYSLSSLGEYSGTAGDSFSYHKGAYFSTQDKDNSYRSCTQRNKGGWWYLTCFLANLNGKYSSDGTNEEPNKGVHWYHFTSTNTSLLRTKMMVRPR